MQQWSTCLAQLAMYITDIKVNDGRKSAFFFDQVDIFEGITSLKPQTISTVMV